MTPSEPTSRLTTIFIGRDLAARASISDEWVLRVAENMAGNSSPPSVASSGESSGLVLSFVPVQESERARGGAHRL